MEAAPVDQADEHADSAAESDAIPNDQDDAQDELAVDAKLDELVDASGVDTYETFNT